MKNLLTVVLALAGIYFSAAHAVTVSYDFTNTNVAGGDQSGKTSPFLAPANLPIGNIFVETFDARNGGGNGQGCGLDNPVSGLVAINGGTYDFRKGNVLNVAKAPTGDSGCYAYGPTADGTLPDVVKIDYAGLLGTLGAAASFNYFGLYYGSIDTYNDLTFYNASGGVIETITGTELISMMNGTSGTGDIYVNLFFTPDEQFTAFSFRTTGRAFEMDNLAMGYNVVNQVPEPGSLALVGAALLGLLCVRRRKGTFAARQTAQAERA